MTQPAVTHLSSAFDTGFFTCRNVQEQGEASIRLKRFGICAGREIEVVQAGDPMVVRVLGTRVGLSRKLGALIEVEESDGQLAAANSGAVAAGG